MLAWLLALGLAPTVSPLVETTRTQAASELWAHEVAVTRRTHAAQSALPAASGAASGAVALTLVLDEASPAFVLHAAKHALLALPAAHALLVAAPSSSSSVALFESAAAAASLTVSALTRVQVTESTHVLLTGTLLEYPAPALPLTARVTRLAADAAQLAELLRGTSADEAAAEKPDSRV